MNGPICLACITGDHSGSPGVDQRIIQCACPCHGPTVFTVDLAKPGEVNTISVRVPATSHDEAARLAEDIAKGYKAVVTTRRGK